MSGPGERREGKHSGFLFIWDSFHLGLSLLGLGSNTGTEGNNTGTGRVLARIPPFQQQRRKAV
jgi:hypothetical protein